MVLSNLSKVILVAIRKGGTGKTHTATHLAFYFNNKKSERTLFIEFDGQLNGATQILNSPYGYRLNVTADMLFSQDDLPELDLQEGIAVIAPKDKNFDLIDKEDNSRIGFVKKNIETLKQHFDKIIIDTPPSSLLRVNASLVVSDFVLSPLELSQESLQGVQDHVEKIAFTKSKFNPNLEFLGMIFNKYDSRIQVDKKMLGLMLKKHGKYVFKNVLKDRKAPYKTARAECLPVWDIKSSAAKEATAELMKVFEEIEERMKVVV